MLREKISIIIPVYNEKESLKDFLAVLKETLRQIDILFECIIVDDGSTDSSADILKDSGLVVLSHHAHLGYGAAIKTGIKKASSNVLCIIDADGTYFPDDLKQLLPFISKYDMVVGSRREKSSIEFPIYQRVAKGLVALLLKNIFKQNVEDINSGFRLFKKNFVENFLFLLPDGFSFTASITLIMLLCKLGIKYAPIEYFGRKGKSKVQIFSYSINFVRSYLRIICSFHINRKLWLPDRS